MIKEIRQEVCKLLNNDNSGHGMEHIDRVLNLSLKFADIENANKEIVALIALLHDVDDYKLFGTENADNLINARKILEKHSISDNIKEKVLNDIKNIGYSKRIKGCFPSTIEGQIVSDADMCDALGANGILREYTYCLKHGKPFFNKDIFPFENISTKEHTNKCADSSVCHIFEKILKLKNLMLTEPGKEEAKSRHEIIIIFLYQLFKEENAQDWIEYLNNYINEDKKQLKLQNTL